MCWFMAYYEVKIRPRGNSNSHLEECYRRVMAWLEEKENRFQHIVNDLRSCVKSV